MTVEQVWKNSAGAKNNEIIRCFGNECQGYFEALFSKYFNLLEKRGTLQKDENLQQFISEMYQKINEVSIIATKIFCGNLYCPMPPEGMPYIVSSVCIDGIDNEKEILEKVPLEMQQVSTSKHFLQIDISKYIALYRYKNGSVFSSTTEMLLQALQEALNGMTTQQVPPNPWYLLFKTFCKIFSGRFSAPYYPCDTGVHLVFQLKIRKL